YRRDDLDLDLNSVVRSIGVVGRRDGCVESRRPGLRGDCADHSADHACRRGWTNGYCPAATRKRREGRLALETRQPAERLRLYADAVELDGDVEGGFRSEVFDSEPEKDVIAEQHGVGQAVVAYGDLGLAGRQSLETCGPPQCVRHLLDAALRELVRVIEDRGHQVRRRRTDAVAFAVVRRAEDMSDLVRGDEPRRLVPAIDERRAVNGMANRIEIRKADESLAVRPADRGERPCREQMDQS